MINARSYWVTGAANGVGLALAQGLLEQGHRVAASGKDCQELNALAAQHGANLLCLDGQLQDASEAHAVNALLQARWGALDGLIINAGTCDYLPTDLPANELIGAIATSNLLASEHALAIALALLAKGDRPQVMGLVSRYSALQLGEPTQPLRGANSLPQWFRTQRQHLQDQGIDLTLVAPGSLKAPVTSEVLAIPEDWTATRAAAELIKRLEARQPELVLEVLDPTQLWPLPH
ncbi:SDR family NAD(P)-dependent oxidoreductase [Pseudomonas entomophila]|uniref:SDR family NAD(P)-dependent oxidoreductase n=1 Tax=Pseudomonas entomophila TaxID=312306 RepID=UPI0023D8C3EE|nr:SDR family NAD(P)-dependent oxidoreductase [Pseudomonas entomophila]MDF0730142.1 SDR family NAD(P)-dependent oxidoreductase [Pseudomonas entomophila]